VPYLSCPVQNLRELQLELVETGVFQIQAILELWGILRDARRAELKRFSAFVNQIRAFEIGRYYCARKLCRLRKLRLLQLDNS
jgi:hypothetical protein